MPRPPITRVPFGIKALLVANFFHTFAFLGLYTFAGDQVYGITGRELDLGLLGLVIFLPVFFLSPFSGTLVDRLDRRVVYAGAIVVEVGVSTALYFHIRSGPDSVGMIFALIAVYGAARAFAAPASRAMPIDLAPPEILEKVIPLKALAFQAGVIAGPIAAGFAAVVADELPFLMAAILLGFALIGLAFVPKPPIEQLATGKGATQAWRDALEGITYIRRNPILRGAISLDLFAVLLGGATALLPAIAEERLGVGEVGLGWLRAADGIGAAAVSLVLTRRPIRRRLGRVLLSTVGIFGVAVIFLGITQTYAVAFIAILVLSGADAISVYIRSSLVPLATPEVMRGRVIAVENVFIGGSNELGALESGVAGQALGLVGAIVTGGIGTLVIVALWWRLFPELRDVDRFDDVRIARVTPLEPESRAPQ